MKAPRKDTLETRRQIVNAAEKLFAEHGIDNVGLLDISREAGQKNRNAAQYHYDNKANLITAVLDRHTDEINIRRALMLEQLKDTKKPQAADLIKVLVLPVAEHVASTGNSMAFLLINSQMMTTQALATMRKERTANMPEVKRLNALFAKVLPKASAEKQKARLLLVQSMLHHGLASFHSLYPGKSNKGFVESLCTGIEAVLTET